MGSMRASGAVCVVEESKIDGSPPKQEIPRPRSSLMLGFSFQFILLINGIVNTWSFLLNILPCGLDANTSIHSAITTDALACYGRHSCRISGFISLGRLQSRTLKDKQRSSRFQFRRYRAGTRGLAPLPLTGKSQTSWYITR